MNHSVNHPAPSPLTQRDILLILAGLLMAMLLAALDQTIVATALPTMGREMGHPDQLPWIVTAYLLTATVVTPLYGKLSDIHGRRIILLIAISVFLLGSLLCALSTTLPMLALARGVQGAGGGGLISLAQTIIGDIMPPRERVRYQVYIATVFIVSSATGPLLGGFLAEHVHWTAIFWINLPLGFAAFLTTDRQLRRIPRHERPHKLDVIGAILLVAATASLMLGLNWGGVRYPWLSPEIIGLFAASLMLWAGFVLRLQKAEEPLIPLSLLSDKTVLGATLAAGCSLAAFIGPAAFTPFFFESVLGLSATQSGAALLPLMVGTVVGATTAGRAMVFVRHYLRVPMAGLSMSFIAASLLAANPAGFPLPLICVLQGVLSAGLGMVLSVATVSIQNRVAPHQLGTALSSSNLFRQLGSALAVAICGSILSAAGFGVAEHGHAGALGPDSAGYAALIAAYRDIFIITAIGALGAIVSLRLVEEHPLRGATSERGSAPASPR